MLQSQMILAGNVVREPRTRQVGDSLLTTFRMAADNTRRDRSGQWVTTCTYFTVSCWRELGANVAASLRKGHPVVVIGRPREDAWERDGVRRVEVEVVADVVAHDLTRGRSTFERTRRGPQTSDVVASPDAVTPAEPSQHADAPTPVAA